MKTKNNIVLFAILTMTVLAGTIVSIYGHQGNLVNKLNPEKNKYSDEFAYQKTENSAMKSEYSSRGEQIKEAAVLDQAGFSQSARGISMIDNSIEKSDNEEEVYLDELFRKTDEVFWELAPRIIEEILREEEKDVHWESQVTAVMNNFIKDKLIDGAQFVGTDCRKTLCKVSVTLPSEQQVDSFIYFWNTRGPEKGSNYGHHEEQKDGSTKTTVYFTKNDVDQPFIEARKRMADFVSMNESKQ